MFKFDNNTIFTGYLKQVLNQFNLPKFLIYTQAHAKYFEENGEESPEILQTITKTPEGTSNLNSTIYYIPYLRNGKLQEYIDGHWLDVGKDFSSNMAHVHHYAFGDKILNLTRNLKINNNIYDTYTHEYLGDYLRFKRDYEGINLMPLYNCFNNYVCEKLSLTVKPVEGDWVSVFNSLDSQYKIYAMPVKMFQKYTIAIDSDHPVELCCGLYGAYLDSRQKSTLLSNNTYKRYAKCTFNQPFVFTKLRDYCLTLANSATTPEGCNSLIELAQNEQDLKLFIKLPVQNNSTITVLEGDYSNWNNSRMIKTYSKAAGDSNPKDSNPKFYMQYNHSIINLEPEILAKYATVPLITPLQLLAFNTKTQHPFSDRLVEYLLENCITSSENELPGNIRRVQKVIQNNNKLAYEPLVAGMWDTNISKILYEQMMQIAPTKGANISNFRDILGYVDKDVENFYSTKNTDTDNKESLLSVELTEEDMY